MAIIDSVRKLAEKVGADTNGRTIADQMNLINQHLEATNGRDISEAVNYYADKAGGSTPTPETFEVEMTFTVDSLRNPQTVSYTSTKKLPEVINAIDSGKKVDFAINITDGTESVNLPLFGYVKYIEDDMVSIFISTYEGSRPDKPTLIAWAGDNTSPSLTGFTTQALFIPPAN